MIPYVLSELFFKIYAELNGEAKRPHLRYNDDINKLESSLRNFLIYTIGYRKSYIENLKEVEIAFENIINNSKNYKGDLLSIIELYSRDYVNMLDKHPYTKIFIDSVNNLYSEKFDIKKVWANTTTNINLAIKHRNKRLEIFRLQRINEEAMPSMIIINIDSFEQTLENYIESIKNSDSYYNIFSRAGFSEMKEEEKLKMIFEGTVLNLTPLDGQNIEEFIKNYSDFVSDKSFEQIRYPVHIGTLFEDELYVMAKRSELWYETPYYLSFMLKNKKIELPNVRIGISTKGETKVAHIIATQTSQIIYDKDQFDELQQIIKSNIPSDNYFRFYNPTHVVSLLITFGLLKGIGINDIIVKDYMPFRYKKVINDKQLNEEEANIYQTRLTTKNLATYMRIVANVKGIEVVNLPDIGSELVNINDVVIGENQFLNDLYNIGIEVGKNMKENEYHPDM